VATKDRVLDLAAVGQSDLASGRKMATNDLFWIASMTKPMTAVAAAILVDDGRLNFSDPVEKYLPEFHASGCLQETTAQHRVLVPAARPITVRDLLTHTSGIGEYVAYGPHWTLAEMIKGVVREPLRFQPGANGAIRPPVSTPSAASWKWLPAYLSPTSCSGGSSSVGDEGFEFLADSGAREAFRDELPAQSGTRANSSRPPSINVWWRRHRPRTSAARRGELVLDGGGLGEVLPDVAQWGRGGRDQDLETGERGGNDPAADRQPQGRFPAWAAWDWAFAWSNNPTE